MPNKDGGTTFLEMKNINPGVKALFCSGYVSDQVIQSLLAEEKLRAIQKPVRPEEFLKAAREVLDG
jgi:DNA-binding NarL/FixJ family response regulator